MDKTLKIALLFCLVMLQTTLVDTIYAQEPDEVEDTPLIISPSGQLSLSLEQLGYGPEELTGGTEGVTTVEYRVELPGNFRILPTGNYLDLTTSHLPETPEVASLLEIVTNRQPLSAIELTADKALLNTTRIDLPEQTLGRINNIVVNLDTSGTCDNPGGFLKVLISESSTVNLNYEQIPYPADLGRYPFPFVERSLLDIPVTIVLPDQPTSVDLSAAATIVAGLGQASQDELKLTTVLASDLTPEVRDDNHLIVIGNPDSNIVLNELALPVPIDILEAGQGMLQEIVSPWNDFRLVLAVISNNDEGLLKAGQALNRQAHFLGMRGPVAIVVELGDIPKAINADDTTSFTLSSLEYEDEVFYGVAPQRATFDFFLPRGTQLNEVPFVALKFSHAGVILPESTLNLFFNGMPIGSTLLDDSNTEQGELTVSLPTRRLREGRNRLVVEVEMALPNGDPCIDLDNTQAWTVISSDSEIFLPYSNDVINIPVDLGELPYPFSQTSGFDQTTFILPDQPSSEIIDQLIQTVTWMGNTNRSQDILVKVSYASEVNEEISTNSHLIIFGRPTENPILAEVNAYLPQPFVPNSNNLEPLKVDNVAFLPDPEREAGLLQVIESPWNEAYSVLVVTGTTDAGIALAAQSILDVTDLEGNLAVIEPVLDPFSDEGRLIETFSIDTRPQPDDHIGLTLSEKNPALSNRWWQ